MPCLIFKSFDRFSEYVEENGQELSGRSAFPKDPSSIYKSRSSALAYEALIRKSRALPNPVYAICEKGSVIIDDLGMTLSYGQIIDVAGFSKQTVLSSSGLKICFGKGFVRFLKKEELKKLNSFQFNDEDYGVAILDSCDEFDDGSKSYKETCTKFINIKKGKNHGTKIKITNPKRVETVSGRQHGDMESSLELNFLDTETGLPRDEMGFTDDFSSPSNFITYENGTMRPMSRDGQAKSSATETVRVGRATTKSIPPKSGEGGSSFVVEID